MMKIMMLTAAVAKVVMRVSRMAKELKLIMLMMVLITAVEVNTLTTRYSFVEIRIFDADFGLEIRILTPSRVELIGKRSIFGLETTTNR
mmetsp:Transcript_12615/g.18826  ORF Transcript_12615/g.18826 Transcript_12615/m.18826 type:complete len:89 (-) Transcript_12615:514-780(-)